MKKRKLKTGWTCGGKVSHQHRWYWTASLCGWIQWGFEWIKYPFLIARYYFDLASYSYHKGTGK